MPVESYSFLRKWEQKFSENYNSSGGILCFALYFEKIPPGLYLLNDALFRYHMFDKTQ